MFTYENLSDKLLYNDLFKAVSKRFHFNLSSTYMNVLKKTLIIYHAIDLRFPDISIESINNVKVAIEFCFIGNVSVPHYYSDILKGKKTIRNLSSALLLRIEG